MSKCINFINILIWFGFQKQEKKADREARLLPIN